MIASTADFKKFYPFPHKSVFSCDLNGIQDPEYPGTACLRLAGILARLEKLDEEKDLSQDWVDGRRKLLWAGGLKDDMSTSHAFNDDNHCDLTPMKGSIANERN